METRWRKVVVSEGFRKEYPKPEEGLLPERENRPASQQIAVRVSTSCKVLEGGAGMG
jgi:hypothetical protein